MKKVELNYNKKKYVWIYPESMNDFAQQDFIAYVTYVVDNPVHLSIRTQHEIEFTIALLKHDSSVFFNAVTEGGYFDILSELNSFVYQSIVANKWFVKQIEVDREVFFGPNDKFKYMMFAQFIAADMLVMSYQQVNNEHKESVLNRICAVLMRKQESNEFEKFDTKNLDVREKLFAKLDINTKKAILYNYIKMREWIAESYPRLFPQSATTENEVADISSWMKIRRHIAGNVLNVQNVDSLYLSEVLYDLNEQLKEAKK